MKKMMMNRLWMLIFAAVGIFLVSCNNEKKEQKSEENIETMNSGKIEAYIDESFVSILQEPINWYKKDYPRVELKYHFTDARQAMSKLLAGETRVIITARGYLKDEDSLMKIYKVKPHQKQEVAYDALVMFVANAFPLDTINASQIDAILSENINLTKYFPKLISEPQYATLQNSSSEYANLMTLAANGKAIKKRLSLFRNNDSLKAFVKSSINNIGFGYLSNVVKDTSFKLIKIGFIDSANKYINPKPVHQGYIVQGLYPYKVTLWVYVLEDRKNLPFWFGKFFAVEEKVQRYFLKSGIVPAFARIKLIPEDE